MNSKKAISILLCAIDKVKPDYIYYGGSWENFQVERCFAYELYHQWRSLLDKYYESHRNENRVYLNGEIPKNVGGRECLYPDLVLHSGQGCKKEQILACEIKRGDNKDLYAICRDIYKLLKYLDFYKDGNQDIHIEYEEAVFIMVGCPLSKMGSIINDALNKSIDDYPKDKQTDIESYLKEIKGSTKLNRILCIAIERIEKEGSAHLNVESCRLNNIIKQDNLKENINDK